MKYLGLIFIMAALTYLHAYALEVVLDPYDYLDYEEINVYTFGDSECSCEE